MEISGYVIALLVGLILGLIGGGGSILTLPVLVYLMGVSPKTGTTYSLLIVGITALVASLQKTRQQQVDFKTVLLFGLPSIVSVYLTRQWLLPMVPETIIQTGKILVNKDRALMLLFGIIMLISAMSMLKNKKQVENTSVKSNVGMLTLEGILVGFITGLVGVGGGFLIIPALTLFARIPMKTAIGTSLMIIAINAAVGFIGDMQTAINIDWILLTGFSSLSVIGSLIGNKLGEKTNNDKLKRYFAWFVFGMGVFILIKESLL